MSEKRERSNVDVDDADCIRLIIKQNVDTYVNFIIDSSSLGNVDKERNSTYTKLYLIFGQRVKLYYEGKEEPIFVRESRLIQQELYDMLYSLLEECGECN